MAHTPICLVCEQEMVRGFIADMANAAFFLPRWIEGEPKAGWWTGGEAREKQWRQGTKVTAYRCPECFALRLYALPTDDQADPPQS